MGMNDWRSGMGFENCKRLHAAELAIIAVVDVRNWRSFSNTRCALMGSASRTMENTAQG
jgi:hypothetical protein